MSNFLINLKNANILDYKKHFSLIYDNILKYGRKKSPVSIPASLPFPKCC